MPKPQEKVYDFTIEEVCMSILAVNRFYATILSKMVKIETPQIPTAGVGFNKFGKLCMYYNKDFVLSLELKPSQGLIVHEVLHVFFRHLTRFILKDISPTLRDTYNIGMDMAINQYIPHLPEGGAYPKDYNLPEDKNADFYIEELKKRKQENQCQKCGSPMPQKQQDQDDENSQEDQQQDQNGQTCPSCGHDNSEGKTLDSHELWDKVIDENGQVKDAKEFDIDPEYEVTTAVMKSIKECRDYGSLPAFVEREIENLKSVKRFNWKKQLKIFVNTVLTAKKRLSQKRVNRRFTEMEYILPGKKKSRNPKLLLVRDTSGSMYDDAIQTELLNEMIQISKSASVLVCDCDTRVHQTYEVRSDKDFKAYKGGGGTSFEPAFEVAKKLNVDGIVYLTDTYGSFPNKKDIGKFASKTIWVTFSQEKVSIPFGKHVNIDTTLK